MEREHSVLEWKCFVGVLSTNSAHSAATTTVEDTEDSTPKDGRRWSINRNLTAIYNAL